MKFLHYEFLPVIIIFLGAFFYWLRKREIKYFSFVEKYWFFKRSSSSRFASIFYFLALSFLSLSLLDFRGKEDQIQGEIPDQKTIIVIDCL